jgi:hypothetical protein
VGLFDEELVRNQDDELNLRIVRSGGRVWQSPAIRSTYAPRSSLANLFSQYRQYGYWKVRVIQKHTLPASIRHVVPGAFVLAVLGLALLALVWSPRAHCSRSFAAYRRGEPGRQRAHLHAAGTFRYLPVIPIVFAGYHVGYGTGFCAVWSTSCCSAGRRCVRPHAWLQRARRILPRRNVSTPLTPRNPPPRSSRRWPSATTGASRASPPACTIR